MSMLSAISRLASLLLYLYSPLRLGTSLLLRSSLTRTLYCNILGPSLSPQGPWSLHPSVSPSHTSHYTKLTQYSLNSFHIRFSPPPPPATLPSKHLPPLPPLRSGETKKSLLDRDPLRLLHLKVGSLKDVGASSILHVFTL